MSGRTIAFTKGQGTGNDFILILDEAGELDLNPAAVARLCDRRFGIGADGLIRVVPSRFLAEGRKLLEQDPAAQWFMDYRNGDGSVSEMCGNGVRVFARFLTEKNLVKLSDGDTLTIGTRAGLRDIQGNLAGYAVDMGRWKLDETEVLVQAGGLEVARPGLHINVGNPHVVVALASAEELSALRLHDAPLLTPQPPDGANVEFVVPRDPMVNAGVGAIDMRVFERGVGETMSCGTGVVAAALATRFWAGAGAPNQWQVTVPGGTLAVRMFPTEEGEHVGLSGAAQLSFDGTVELLATDFAR